VVGGGVIGASISFQLAKGGIKVMLLERASIGGEATGASAGMIIPHRERETPAAFRALSRESARLYRPLADELRERTGADVGYRRAGLLEIALDQAEELALRRQQASQIAGEQPQWVGSAEALDLEPALNPAVRAALYQSDSYQVFPRLLAQTLARAAVDLGCVIREHTAVERLNLAGDRVNGVWAGTELIRADDVIIATGSWSAAWADALKTAIPVRPVRGQLVGLRTGGTALRTVISGAGGYAITKADGRTIIGTTVEEAGFDARPTVDAIGTLLRRAPLLSPGLAKATVESAWAGLRPGTPDGLPLLGRVGNWRGVILATGHFRNGILLAPITAEVVSDLVFQRTPRMSIGPFDPARFVPHAA
jgi:glycine oxidase